MPVSPREFNTIVSDLRDRIFTTAPELDTSEGTFSRIAWIDPLALEIDKLEALLLEVQESQSLLTARGADLDLLAFNYNVQRRGAQKASGFVQFYKVQAGFTDPITIPKGTLITSINGVTYETLYEGVLNGFDQSATRNSVAVYQITIPVQAQVDGVVGNANANTLTSSNLAGINVTNDASIQGGYEQETDDSLVQRAILSFGVWSRGTKQAVEYGARLVPGVFYASAVYAYAGHFNLFVSDQAGNLSDEMKGLVDDIMEDWAGAGNGWTIQAPPLYLLNTTFRVIFRTNVNIDLQTADFQTDVAELINAVQTSSIYIDDFIVSLKTKTTSYVAHFDMDVPSAHVLQPEGTIIRSGTVTVINET